MKEIKKSASFKSKQKGKDVQFKIDLNYSPEYDSFIIKVKEGEGFMAYSSNIERMPLEVIQKLNEMLEEVLIKAGSETEMKEHKMFDGGDFQSGVYAEGGNVNWQKYPTKNVRGLYEIKGDGINRKVNIVFFERYDDDLYSLYPLDKDKHLFREIMVKSTALNSLDKGVSVQGETNDGKKVSIKRLSNQDFSYAEGGSLQAHGIEVGDTFLTTISGNIQKVKDKNGKIVYVDLSNGKRDTQQLLPFNNGGMVSEDLFENYNKQPKKLSEIVNRYMKKYDEGEMSYQDTKNFLKEVEAIGYTFDYGLDNEPYGLRPTGTKLKEYDEGGEVTYFLNKDGIKVRSKVEPKRKLTEAEWMAKYNDSKEARTYGFGGLFSKSAMMSKPKPIDLNQQQVRLKSGEYVQVLNQQGDTLMVMDLTKLGTRTAPKYVKLSDVDMTSLANGGGVGNGGGSLSINKESDGKYSWKFTFENGKIEKSFDSFNTLADAKRDFNYRSKYMKMANGGGVGLIGNQKRIDMNKNGKIDAEDFKLLRSSMNGAWRNERKHVNHNEDYEVRYARKKPSRTGYKGKRMFGEGGGISNLDFRNFTLNELIQNLPADVSFMYISKKNSTDKIRISDKEFKNFKFKHWTITDYGNMELSRGSENLYLDIMVFESSNDAPEIEYIISIYTKDNHKGLKLFANNLVEKFAGGGGVDDKKKYEIIFEDVFSFATTKKEAEMTNSQYQKALQQKNNKVIVVDFYNKSKGIREQLRIKDIKLKYGNGGGISTAERFKKVVAKNREANRVKPMSQKMSSGAEVKKANRGGVMVLAKKIRKEGESWKDALKRAGQQLK